jgi:hypothetical protein
LQERGIPVVFASGYELRERAPGSFDGAVCITKPYTTERLRQALAAALANAPSDQGATKIADREDPATQSRGR